MYGSSLCLRSPLLDSFSLSLSPTRNWTWHPLISPAVRPSYAISITIVVCARKREIVPLALTHSPNPLCTRCFRKKPTKQFGCSLPLGQMSFIFKLRLWNLIIHNHCFISSIDSSVPDSWISVKIPLLAAVDFDTCPLSRLSATSHWLFCVQKREIGELSVARTLRVLWTAYFPLKVWVNLDQQPQITRRWDTQITHSLL